jgi:hypothetical protein
MAKNESKRITPAQLQADRDSFAALQANDKYAPANPAFAIVAITAVHNGLSTDQQTEAQAVAAAAAARDNAVAREWEFHNLILGAKDQVVAQFGRDSNEAQAVGLKKKSEYKARKRKPPEDK